MKLVLAGMFYLFSVTLLAQGLDVLPNGNVGIGTTIPKAKLEVSGLSESWVPGTSSVGSFFLSANTGIHGLAMGTESNGTSWLQAGRVDSATPYLLKLNPNGGDVSLGSNAIVAKLTKSSSLMLNGNDISNGYGQAVEIFVSGGIGYLNAFDRDNGVAEFPLVLDAKDLIFKTGTIGSGFERLRITTDGNVGVGTPIPTHKLQVVGEVRASSVLLDSGSGALKMIPEIAGSPTYITIDNRVNAGGKKWRLGHTGATSSFSSFDVYNETDNVCVLSAQSTGMSVGVEMSVTGAVTATAFKVGGVTLSVPDFVFEKNYALKSLEEVEAAIEEMGHLPGVPSAKEINEKGLDMVQMQLKLLEKVEELTLYSIEQNKAIKEAHQALKQKDAQMAELLNRLEKLENQGK